MQPLQTAVLKQVDRPVAIAFGFIVVLLLAGSLYSSSFLPANYLLQQLQVAAFLGLIASGVMLVIRSEEHTSEHQSPMRTTDAVFCLQIKQQTKILKNKLSK